jgi:hypothetical protein
MSEQRRTSDDLGRLLADYERRIKALEGGRAGSVLIPVGYPGGGAVAVGVIGVPFVVAGIVTGRTLWTTPIVALTTTTTLTVRVETAGSWTVTAGALRLDQSQTAVASASHGGTGPWSGTLSLSNGGGTPTTGCILYLAISVSSSDQVRVVTSAVAST